MPDMSFISIAANSVNAALNLVKAAIEVRDANIAMSRLADVNRALLEAQAALTGAREQIKLISERNELLERKVAQREAWAEKKERYALTDVADGFFAYRTKQGAGDDVIPAHDCCAKCFSEEKAAPLQYMRTSGGIEFMTCSGCGTKTLVRNYRRPQ